MTWALPAVSLLALVWRRHRPVAPAVGRDGGPGRDATGERG
ncbi:hypothetical protein [Streptomyces glaucosporus]